MTQNADTKVVQGFAREWTKFDQSELRGAEFEETFNSYFAIFPWNRIADNAVGFDLGCGSGRWARGVAPRVGRVHCIDANEDILNVARGNLREFANVIFHRASVDAMPMDDSSMDFGYSLGVLHHIPDTQAGLSSAVSKLKIGAPFLLYLYYAFDNRPRWFVAIWKISEPLRYLLSRSPFGIRYVGSQIIAALVYFPLARIARILEALSVDVSTFPLSAYRTHSFYTMRTDALDRLGTRLEKRFSRAEITRMMQRAGLAEIVFSEEVPFWCAVGTRRS